MRLDRGIGWSLNGFDLSGIDPAGVRWLVKDVESWDDPPSTKGGVTQSESRDGGWVEPTFLEAHPLVLKARLLAPTRAEAIHARDAFKSAIPVRFLAPLVLLDGALVRHRWVKQEGRPSIKQVSDYHVEISVQLVAPDPRMFSGDGTSDYTYRAQTVLPQTSGGLQAGSLQVPTQVGAAAVSGSVTLTNKGSGRPPAKLTITDAINPSISSADGGRMDFALTLGAGQTLEVDLDRRTVKVNGVSRRNAMTGKWITPAGGLTLQFNATTYNTAARMTAQWSDAWS